MRLSLSALLIGGVIGAQSVIGWLSVAAGVPSTEWSWAALSQARESPSAATVGTKVLFAGGSSPVGESDAVDIYDNATGQWTAAALAQPRMWLAVATVGTKVLFAGGASGMRSMPPLPLQESDAVDIYDAATEQWSTARLSQSRSSLAAATVGTKVLFAGGSSPVGASDAVDIYDSATGQ